MDIMYKYLKKLLNMVVFILITFVFLLNYSRRMLGLLGNSDV